MTKTFNSYIQTLKDATFLCPNYLLSRQFCKGMEILYLSRLRDGNLEFLRT